MYLFFFRLPKRKSPLLFLFQKSVVIVINDIKIICIIVFSISKTRFRIHNLLFFFSFPFKKKKKRNKRDQHSNIFSFQPCTCSRMCLLYTFLFSFGHAPECAYCTPICHVIQFCLYFTLAKDSVKRNCIYAHMFVPVIVFHEKKKKKKKRPVRKYG